MTASVEVVAEPVGSVACPRIRKSGSRLGLEPISRFSAIRNPGSMAESVRAMSVLLNFFRSSPLIVVAEPVYPSFLRWNIPVTTTS